MNDVTVVTSVTYPSPESLALVADVQYHEPYLSAALNRKFRGIVDPGFYAGFLPKPGGGMKLLITSVDGDKTAGAASVNIGEFYQVTIQQRKDISLALSAGKKYAIVLKGRYLLGEDSYQVNTASHIHAAEFVARTYTDSYQLGDGELLVCTVNIPAGVSAITQEMIDVSDRIDLTIGIEISDSVTSTRSDVAASSLAVKKAYDLAKSKYTAQDASTTQKGLVQLSSATNSTSEVLAATPKAVKAAYDLANGKYTAQDATTTQKGIVQLSSDTNSTSETLAATPKAVKAAYDLAAGKAPSSHTHPWNQITGVPTASLTAKGITQLSSATNSTSEVLAATPKAVKAAYDLANGKYTAQDATTTQKGIVQLSSDTNSTSETLAATPKAVKAAYDLAAGKAPSSHTHPWNQITGVPTASLTAKGITQLSSATNSTSEVLAATPKAVKAAYDLANGKQAADATLTALAALATAADKLPYFTGVDRAALTALTSVGRAILSKPSIQSVLNYLGLGETIDKASGAMQKSANGYDISDVSAFRNALQLGTAATRDVGADNASKLLDLDSFRSMMSGNGYIYIPCIATTGNPVKLMLQWGMVATQKGVDAGYALPFAFPYAGLFATGNRGTSGYNAAMNVRIASRTHISIQNWSPSGEGTEDCCFIALGY